MKSSPRLEATVMNVHLSCQTGRVLIPPRCKLEHPASGVKTASQDLVSMPLIQMVLTEVEAAQSYRFELGDDIMAYSPNSPQSGLSSEADSLFLIVSGTVRLLAGNEGLQKTVSVACLGPGEAFGCDRSFYGHPLPYWAKAASPCHLVRLPIWAVDRALGYQWPLLLNCLQRQMRRRSQLAFFKQCTPLGAVPSTTLSRHLLPRLEELPLQAGSSLAQYPLTPGDYLWLRQGCLLNPSVPSCSPQVGDGWRYASPVGSWVAQADGLLYRLASKSPVEVKIKRLL